MRDRDIAVTRRRVVQSAIVGMSLGAVSTPVLGRPGKGRATGNSGDADPSKGREEKGRISLIDGPAKFQVFVGESGDDADDPDEAAEFGFPGNPTIAGEDPADGGLFDAGKIEKTPNGNTLHHVFEFFQGLVIRRDRGKPYVLRHEGEARFTSRGQHVNFEARSTDELRALLDRAGLDPALADRDPLETLAGGTWRGVGADIVQLVDDSPDSRRIRSSVTRVDFYRRGQGRPTYELSALYAIYPNLDEEGSPEPASPGTPTNRGMPSETNEAGLELIEDGRRNLGGQ
jgi:hypothetical protein